MVLSQTNPPQQKFDDFQLHSNYNLILEKTITSPSSQLSFESPSTPRNTSQLSEILLEEYMSPKDLSQSTQGNVDDMAATLSVNFVGNAMSSPASEWSSISSQHDNGSVEDFNTVLNPLVPAAAYLSPTSPGAQQSDQTSSAGTTPLSVSPQMQALQRLNLDAASAFGLSSPTSTASMFSASLESSQQQHFIQSPNPSLNLNLNYRTFSEPQQVFSSAPNTPSYGFQQPTRIAVTSPSLASPFFIPGQELRRRISSSIHLSCAYTEGGDYLRSLDMLQTITRTISENIDELGLTISIPNHDPVPFWDEINGAWLNTLKKLEEFLRQSSSFTSGAAAAQQSMIWSMVDDVFILRLREFITSVGDILQPFGLLDYENGFSEENVLNILDSILEITPKQMGVSMTPMKTMNV